MNKNLTLNWPASLAEVTLKNVTVTELWFLKEHLSNNNFDNDTVGYTVTTPKFGYSECHVDIDDTRYLVKHKQFAGSPGRTQPDTFRNVVFYVQKYKKPI